MNDQVVPSLILLVLSIISGCTGTPNFIVFQPDDMAFFEEWTPPAHFPSGNRNDVITFDDIDPVNGLPNIETLRTSGLQMMQAYTTSSVCGTSRYSTMTGRYPSRSAFSRARNAGSTISTVVIPRTKLQDSNVVDGDDCTTNNIAAALKANGYRTGVVGKWHLARTGNTYSYDSYTAGIRECGFDFAEAIYPENLGSWAANDVHHNMEHVVSEAINFISEESTDPFFLYVNPTANHASGLIYDSLTQYDCKDTVAGRLDMDPYIKGMTAEYGGSCAAYRQSILDRAAGTDNQALGSIWVDDAVGAILKALEATNQLDNTFFLFQMDHGYEGKNSMFEPGNRLAQFIHYPDGFGTSGRSFGGLVSTIDIAPTILDFAGVDQSAAAGYYLMDGLSWKHAVTDDYGDESTLSVWRDERCLAFELGQDRAIRCGCDKYLQLNDLTSSEIQVYDSNGIWQDSEMLHQLCDGSDTISASSPDPSPESDDMKDSSTEAVSRFSELQAFANAHITRTNPDNTEMDFTPLVCLNDGNRCTADHQCCSGSCDENNICSGSGDGGDGGSTYACDNSPEEAIYLYRRRSDSYIWRTCEWLVGRTDNWCERTEESQNIEVYKICQIECAAWTGC